MFVMELRDPCLASGHSVWTGNEDRMSHEPMRTDLACCRADMAELLREAVEMTLQLELSLDVTGGWPEAEARFEFDADPAAAVRIMGALLLRKARIHTSAVLRANETNNLHSLAVQMRPVLECAGQVVFLFYNLMIAPDLFMPGERALELVGARLNAEHFHTIRRISKGQVKPEVLHEIEAQAQEAAAASVGAPKPKRSKKRRFTQADKVAPLENGREWYNYLSEHFSHATAAEWRGLSWRGGVMTMNKVQDELAFLNLMNYLVNQVAYMNAAAALCPVEGDDTRWEDWVEPALAQRRHVRESSKTLLDAAGVAAAGGLDGRVRTD